MCPDAQRPELPCKYATVCHGVRQFLQGQQGAYGRECDFFLSLEVKRSFHPEPKEPEDVALPF